MQSQKCLKLNTGASFPAVGLGTWRSEPGLVTKAVEEALSLGYRHIDGAYIYNNESEVGAGIRNSGVPREEIFITTKLWNTFHKPEDVSKGLELSLKNLGLSYVDLYLMHWPVSAIADKDGNMKRDETGDVINAQIDFVDTYKAMEKLLETGKVKAIGVSNFTVKNLERLLANTTVIPAVNQVELHPYLPQNELVEYCSRKGIVVTAYSPLGSTAEFNLRDNPAVVEIAKSNNATPSQILLAWGLKRNYAVIPKSTNAKRISENFNIPELTDADFAKINAITRRERFGTPAKVWGKAYESIFD